MSNNQRTPKTLAFCVTFAAAIGLAGCAPEPEEESIIDEGAVDVSGGELQTREVREGEVPVNLPETEMVDASAEEEGE